MFQDLANMLGLPDIGAEMSPPERIKSVLTGVDPDRPPVCFWRHFQPAGSGRALAAATFDFFVRDYDLDIVKVMPDLPYPFPQRSIRTIDDWRLIEPIDPKRSPWVRQQVACIHGLLEEIELVSPIVVTQFSPLAEAMHFAESSEQFFSHLEEEPAVIHQALGVIAENLRASASAVLEAGANGIFFALQGATSSVMPEARYREIGLPYDLLALRGAVDGTLNILHLHGERDLFFELAASYPVHALSWSDRIAGPSLREARAMTNKVLMGGWNEQGAIATGDAEGILAEALDAYDQTGGRGFILAPGCSVPNDTADTSLWAARQTVEQLLLDAPIDNEDYELYADGGDDD